MYKELADGRYCMYCKYFERALATSKIWCSHIPLPQGLDDKLLVAYIGSCEYFSSDEYYADFLSEPEP